MRPTEILSSEHRVIEQVLDCLEKMAKRAQNEGVLDEQPARDAIAFFRGFADQCHHGKEEAHLFPAMEAKGFPRHGGPTGVMLHEHELGRSYVKGMDEAIAAVGAGDARALERFAGLAWGYIGLLREHIEKEDHCLFGMANQALTDDDQEALLAAFERTETEHMGAGTHEKFVRIADDLARQYGVDRTATAGSSTRCCGHH